MSAELTPCKPVEAPRFWWRFSLGSMFLLIGIVAVVLAWWVNGPLKQARAIAEIRAVGGVVNPEYDSSFSPQREEPWFPPDYFGEIHQIELRSNTETARALAAAGRLSKIGFLDLTESGVTDDDLRQIEKLSIGSLWLSGCKKVGNDGMKSVATLCDLETLKLDRTAVSDEGLKHLRGLTSLYHLDLRSAEVTDTGMAEVGRLRGMQYLYISGNLIGDEGLAKLQPLDQLRELDSSNTIVSDAALIHLAGMKDLTELDLHDSPIADDGLVHLGRLPSLKKLDISRSRALGCGLKGLSASSSLEELVIRGIPITDDDIAPIAAMKKLSKLSFSPGRLTEVGVARFWEQIGSRGMTIQHDDPFFQ